MSEISLGTTRPRFPRRRARCGLPLMTRRQKLLLELEVEEVDLTFSALPDSRLKDMEAFPSRHRLGTTRGVARGEFVGESQSRLDVR